MIWKKKGKEEVVAAQDPFNKAKESLEVPQPPPEIRVEPKDRSFSLTLTRDEVLAKVDDLSRDEDVALFLRVNAGQRKYQELVTLREMLE